MNTLALTLDNSALNTANVAAAALEPNNSVRVSAERREEEAGREEERKRVERKVLSPNSAMKMRQREERKEERKEEGEEVDREEDRREEGEEATEEEREEKEEEGAAVVMAVRLCSARREDSTMEGEAGRTRSEEWRAEEEMVVKRSARGTTEAERRSGL